MFSVGYWLIGLVEGLRAIRGNPPTFALSFHSSKWDAFDWFEPRTRTFALALMAGCTNSLKNVKLKVNVDLYSASS